MGSFERHWTRLTPISLALLPASVLFCGVVWLRRTLYRFGWLPQVRLPVPVIVVGNITVGGTGKTPMVLWITDLLKTAGFRPGIVTRGYRGTSRSWPQEVTIESDARLVGDEAVLLARRSGCPVVAGPDRISDGRRLIELGCNILVSDDGLQHYRLVRDLEIAVIDGERRFGNHLCLPGGPLREPVKRLQSVDVRITQGTPAPGEAGMQLLPDHFYRLTPPMDKQETETFRGARVHAIAGIGHPERFFSALRGMGIDVIPHAFRDHHDFQPADLEFGDDLPVLMTEKDAVKCQRFGKSHHWVLSVTARPETGLADRILDRIKERLHG